MLNKILNKVINKIPLSNRIIGVLIILGFVVFYFYSFSYNLTSLEVKSNTDNYIVTLNSNKLSKPVVKHCEEKVCLIEELAQTNYSVNIEKTNYKSLSSKIDLSVSNQIEIKLVKNTTLELIEPKKEIILEDEKVEEKTKEEVFREIKKQKEIEDSYLVIELEGYGDFIFKENGSSLDLYNSGIKLGTFDKQNKEDINLQKIIGNSDYIYLKNGDKHYFVNITIDKIVEFDFGVKIEYLKQSDIENQIQIVTEKGTFIYSFKTGEVSYFSLFHDFIYDGEVYLALIESGDKIRKSNYGFSNDSGNLIVSYNPKTKEKALLKIFSFDYKTLKLDGNEVILSSKSGDEYNVKNY